MAPTCYNNMKNLHYRTQSLPESVYQHQMLHLTHQHQQDQFHHAHLHHHQLGGASQHQSSHIKKRNALRRSQTSVCDLLQSGLSHHRAPLTAGLYEQFLPPPNFNAIGLPVQSRVARSRTQSFYVPGSNSHHYRSGMSRLNGGLVGGGSHLDIHNHNSSPYSYPACDQSSASSWYHHRSVPNIPASYPAQSNKSVTTPLFVDCSVEYDLGEQPVIPADSEPLLSIHPDYINKCHSLPSSPYEKLNRPRSSQELHKSMPDIKTRDVIQRSSCVKMTSRSIRPSPRHTARSNISSKIEATRKLSCESRDSGIGMMNSAASTVQWPAGPMMYNNPGCDLTNTQFPTHHQQTEYMGKVLPTNNNKRFALSGIYNSAAPSAPAAATDNHYQNLRIYYQLAF